MTFQDDTDGSSDHSRVLVVGESGPGRVVAGALASQGADPILVTNRPGGSSPAERVIVWPPGLRVLDDFGVGQRVRAVGKPLTDLRVTGPGSDRTVTCPPDAVPPLVVDRAALDGALSTLVPSAAVRERVVAGVEDKSDAVRVTFGDGERDRFDAVVGADGPTSRVRTMADADGNHGTELHEWSFVCDRRDGSSVTVREFWAEDGFAVLTGWKGRLGVRVVARQDVVAAPHRDDALRTAVMAVDDAITESIEMPDGRSSRYRRIVAHRDGEVFRRGRVALCGTAAGRVGVASGLEPALGLVDAAVLANVLSGNNDVPEALDRYVDCRSRRIRAIREAAGPGTTTDYPPADPGGPLGRIGGLRGVALAPVLGTRATGLAATRRDCG